MKKTRKSKSSQSALSVKQDIVGLITTLVQKLVSLEVKIDTVLSRLSERPVESSRQQPMPSAPVERHKEPRPMYKVICADCGKNCEVPFKPAVGRAVYCKECFTRRKTNGNLAPRVEVPLNRLSPAPRPSPEESQVVKPAAEPAAKKKPPAKKTKKKTVK